MKNFAMLLVNNNRSKAYLQTLIKNNYAPLKVVILEDDSIKLPEHTDSDSIFTNNSTQTLIKECQNTHITFDEKENVVSTLKKNNIPFESINKLDINSDEVITALSKIESEYIIYSGPGGSILREKILGLNKNFIHVHPGSLPYFRGSTTIYYSMFIKNMVSASVIFLTKNIDEGPVLHTCDFEIKDPYIDFDYLFDPCVRAATLLQFFENNYSKKIDITEQPILSKANTYYIIHPVLKHLSILKTRK